MTLIYCTASTLPVGNGRTGFKISNLKSNLSFPKMLGVIFRRRQQMTNMTVSETIRMTPWQKFWNPIKSTSQVSCGKPNSKRKQYCLLLWFANGYLFIQPSSVTHSCMLAHSLAYWLQSTHYSLSISLSLKHTHTHTHTNTHKHTHSIWLDEEVKLLLLQTKVKATHLCDYNWQDESHKRRDF